MCFFMLLLQCVMLGQWGGDGRLFWVFLFVFDGGVRKGLVDGLESFVCIVRGVGRLSLIL